jgi:hypothetical protein
MVHRHRPDAFFESAGNLCKNDEALPVAEMIVWTSDVYARDWTLESRVLRSEKHTKRPAITKSAPPCYTQPHFANAVPNFDSLHCPV